MAALKEAEEMAGLDATRRVSAPKLCSRSLVSFSLSLFLSLSPVPANAGFAARDRRRSCTPATMATVVARMQKRTTPRSASASPVTADSSRNPAARSTRSSGDASHYTPLEGAPPPPRRTARATREKTVVATTTNTRKLSRPSPRSFKAAMTPTKRTANSTATARPNKRKRASLPTPEPESDDQERAASHSAEENSEDDDLELVGTSASSSTPPARKRAQRTAVLPLPSPASTPSKNRSVSIDSTSKFAPKLSSPLKPKPRRSAPALSDLDYDEEQVAAEHDAGVDEEADEDLFGPVASSSVTEASTPRKSSTTSKTTPTRSASRRSNTPSSSSRSSSRIQHLPPAIIDIKNAPASLRSRLVGFHMEDEGYRASKTRDEQDEDSSSSSSGQESAGEEEARRQERRKAKGKDRMMDEDEADDVLPLLPRPSAFDGIGLDAYEHEDEEIEEADLALPIPPPQFSFQETTVSSSSSEPTSTTAATARPDLRTVRRHPLNAATPNQTYVSSPLRAHLLSSLAVLSGSRLPSLPHTLSSDETQAQASIVGLPCLEGGYDEWERPLRSALEECVTKGMGNAVMLLGPRGVGKTMVSPQVCFVGTQKR